MIIQKTVEDGYLLCGIPELKIEKGFFEVAPWGSTCNKEIIPNKETRHFRDFLHVIINVIWPHSQLESNGSFERQFQSAVNDTWII